MLGTVNAVHAHTHRLALFSFFFGLHRKTSTLCWWGDCQSLTRANSVPQTLVGQQTKNCFERAAACRSQFIIIGSDSGHFCPLARSLQFEKCRIYTERTCATHTHITSAAYLDTSQQLISLIDFIASFVVAFISTLKQSPCSARARHPNYWAQLSLAADSLQRK